MERAIALALGVAAWIGVAAIAVVVVNAWQDENQIVAFLPIAAAVLIAWAVGEWVTHRVFTSGKEGGHGGA